MEKQLSNTADRELHLKRVFNAPIALVWEVWTNPDHIRNWWGPNGFTNTIHKMDVKPGGEWDLTMHGPDGTDYKNASIYKEVIKHERLVYEHISGPKFLATITFTADGENTTIDWHMLFESKEQFEQVVKTFKADEGLKQNLEKLQQYIVNGSKTTNNDTQPVIVERTYDAHIATVWEAITDKDRMKQWYFDLKEFRPEVGFEFSFNGGPEDRTYLHVCMITQVIPGRKLVHSWRYDGYEGISFVTFELFDEGGKTRLKLTHEGLESFPADQPDFAKKNFMEGWTHIIGTSLKGYLEK